MQNKNSTSKNLLCFSGAFSHLEQMLLVSASFQNIYVRGSSDLCNSP